VSVAPSSESRASLHRRGEGNATVQCLLALLVRAGLVYTAEVGEYNCPVYVGPSSESRASLHSRGGGMQLSSVYWPL